MKARATPAEAARPKEEKAAPRMSWVTLRQCMEISRRQALDWQNVVQDVPLPVEDEPPAPTILSRPLNYNPGIDIKRSLSALSCPLPQAATSEASVGAMAQLEHLSLGVRFRFQPG